MAAMAGLFVAKSIIDNWLLLCGEPKVAETNWDELCYQQLTWSVFSLFSFCPIYRTHHVERK
jgi:hypothetical protein